jgi:putative membrane protein
MGRIRGAAAGAAGGLAGAALMGLAYAMVAKLIPQPPSHGEDATEKVANTVARVVAGRNLDPARKKTGGRLVHFAMGTGMGALYGLLADTFPPLSAGAGTLFGMAAYVGAHGLAVPALGLARSPIKNGVAQESPEFAAHLVYGLTTEAIRRALS